MGELYWLWMMLIGMTVVVIGLLILIYSIRLMSKLSSGLKRDAGKSAAPDDVQLTDPAIGRDTGPAAADGATVAAISAALMCCARDGRRLIIKSVRRAVSPGNVWERAGRVEQFNRRM